MAKVIERVNAIQLRAMIIQTINFIVRAITRSRVNSIMHVIKKKKDLITSEHKDNARDEMLLSCYFDNTDWNQNFAWLSNSLRPRWHCGKVPSHRFDEWRIQMRQLDDVRGKEKFYARPDGQVTGRGEWEVRGQPANTGLITFRAPQWGWNRLDVARGTRASDSCLLPFSLHYRWSSML